MLFSWISDNQVIRIMFGLHMCGAYISLTHSLSWRITDVVQLYSGHRGDNINYLYLWGMALAIGKAVRITYCSSSLG